MSGNTTYSAQPNDSLMSHSDLPTRMFRDISEKPTQLEIDAWVASKDLFVTIATALDAISSLLTTDAKIVHPQLQHQIDILMYLQRNYQITRKKSDYRQ